MKNTVTTQVRLFLREAGRTPPAEGYLHTLFNSPMGSYYVPVHVVYDPYGQYVDLQYGAADYPEGVVKLWEACRDDFHTIWVRYHIEGEDFDYIFSISELGKSADTICTYRFDHLRLSWLAAETPPPSLARADGLHWVVRERVWGLNVAGAYRAANFRGDICHDSLKIRPGIRSDTTSACLMAGGLEWGYYRLEPEALQAFAAHYSGSFEKVQFYWRRRLVRAEVVHPQEPRWGWAFFSVDGWDNVAHEPYLTYLHRYTQA